MSPEKHNEKCEIKMEIRKQRNCNVSCQSTMTNLWLKLVSSRPWVTLMEIEFEELLSRLRGIREQM